MTYALPATARSSSQRLQALAERAGEVTREKGKVAIERTRLKEEIVGIHHRVIVLEQRVREGQTAIRAAQADQARLAQEDGELGARITEATKTLAQLDDQRATVRARRLPLAMRILIVASVGVAAITWIAGVSLLLRLEPVDGSFHGLTLDQVRWPAVLLLFACGVVGLGASSRMLRGERTAKRQDENRLHEAQDHVRQRRARYQSDQQALGARLTKTKDRIASETKAINQARGEAEDFIVKIATLEKRHAALGEKEEKFSVEADAVRDEIAVLLKVEEAAASTPAPIVEIRASAAAAVAEAPIESIPRTVQRDAASPHLREAEGSPAPRRSPEYEAHSTSRQSWLAPLLVGSACVGVLTLWGLTTIAMSRPPAPDPDMQRELARVAAEQREQERVRQASERARQLWAQADLSTKEAQRLTSAWTSMLAGTDFPAERDLVDLRLRLINSAQRAIADQDAFKHHSAETGVVADTTQEFEPTGATLYQALRDVEGSRIIFTSVPANIEWKDVGIDLSPSDRVLRWARGSWSAGSRWQSCGSEGTDETAAFGLRDYRRFQTFRLMALLMRVGTVSPATPVATGDVWIVQAAVVPHSGRLFVGCNDSDWENNEGQLDLAIVAVPARSSLTSAASPR